MDTCAVEVGLLKKHPCGQNAVAKCANCEMALCTKHAVAQMNAMKQRTGKFMCAECDKANKAADIYSETVFNFSSFTVAAILFLILTIPLARFTDRLIERDRRRRLAGATP